LPLAGRVAERLAGEAAERVDDLREHAAFFFVDAGDEEVDGVLAAELDEAADRGDAEGPVLGLERLVEDGERVGGVELAKRLERGDRERRLVVARELEEQLD